MKYKSGLEIKAFFSIKPDCLLYGRQKPVLCCNWILDPFARSPKFHDRLKPFRGGSSEGLQGYNPARYFEKN
jgi:hypothetical protein